MAQIPNKLLYFSQGSTYRTRQEDEEIRDDSIVFVEDDASIVARQNIFGVRGVYPGTCTTAAGTAAKVATTTPLFPLDSNGKPLPGTTIAIKFSNTNTYKTAGTTMTLNVNSTGAYPIYYNNAEVVSTTSANTIACGYKDRYTYYIFNGTQWVWLSYGIDANTTYSNYTFGNGYGIQYDDGTTTEIEVAFTSYALTDNGRVSVLFRHDVPANATLNINTKGAKPIYVDTDNPVTNEMKIKGGVIKAGDIATFVYKTTQYKATGTGTTTLNRYVLVGINDDHSKQDKPIEFTSWFEGNFGQFSEFPTTEGTARTLTTEELAAIQDIRTNKYNWEAYGVPAVGYWEGNAIIYRWIVPFVLGSTSMIAYMELRKTNDDKYWIDGAHTDFVFSKDLATVATSGSYNDLTDKPNIPSIAGLATETYVNTTVTNAIASKQDKPIGFLGWSETYFNDWQDFPKDEANARELTSSEAAAIQDIHENAWNKEWCFEYGMHPMTYSWNGEDANTWTVLSASGDTVGVMSWVLHYNSDNKYWFTEHQSAIATTDIFATVATSGSYNDLTNKPTIPTVGTLNTNNSTAQTVSSSESFSGRISLHKVSKTGSYNDLLNKPIIPPAIEIIDLT